jgi:hypothetical protein
MRPPKLSREGLDHTLFVSGKAVTIAFSNICAINASPFGFQPLSDAFVKKDALM